MGRGALIAFVVAGLCAACTPDAATRLQTDPLTPPGVAKGGPEVDPFVVADRLMAAGEYELALASYQRAEADQGPSAELTQAMAGANIRLGRLRQAETALRGLLAADPQNPMLWNDLGVVLMEKGETGEAMLVFRKAFALDSGETREIRDNLRVSLAKLEKPEYTNENNEAFALVRRGNGVFTLSEQDP